MIKNKVIKLTLILLIAWSNLNAVLAITDSNLNNNNLSITVDVINTRELNIKFVAVDDINRDTITYIQDASNFLLKTYPIAEIEYNPIIDNKGFYNFTEYPKGGLKLLLQILGRSVYANNDSTEKYERVIGIVHGYWFYNHGYEFRAGISAGPSLPVVMASDMYRSTVSHELGHTYGLCNENSFESWKEDLKRFGVCYNVPNSICWENNNNLGCPTETLEKLYYENSMSSKTKSDLYNFMGATSSDHWVNRDTYNVLLDEFSHATPINVSNRILISGMSNYTESKIEFDNCYIIGQGFAENESELINGNYTIALLDNVSNTIVNVSFNMSYEESYEGAEDENISYFIYVLEFPENTSSIRIYENGIIKDEVNVSPNPPNIELTYPITSESYREPFNITYTASDIDGDTLYYAISLAYDGKNYTTLKIDHNETYYSINPNDFLCGSQYMAKVMVTDGVRTNTSQTFYNFSLVPDPSVDVDEIDVIYMDDTKVVFEIVAINDGCDPVSNLSWTFDLGDGTEVNSNYQVSLQYDEKILVYFEYEYQLGGQKSVNFSITNVSISDYLEYSFEIPNINITNYSIIYSNRSAIVLEYIIKNELPYQMGNVSWGINTGQNNIASIYNITLESGEDIFVFIQENYNNYGTYTITFNASDGINNKTASLVYNYREIDAYNLTTLYQNSTTKEAISEFSIRSLEDLNKNVSWRFDTGEIWINSTINSTVNTTESVMVFIKYDYNETGAYETTAQGLTNISNDTASTIIII